MASREAEELQAKPQPGHVAFSHKDDPYRRQNSDFDSGAESESSCCSPTLVRRESPFFAQRGAIQPWRRCTIVSEADGLPCSTDPEFNNVALNV